MKTNIKPFNEITHEATCLLYRELGVVNTLRFLNQFTIGYGNYIEERGQFFADLSLDDIISEIKRGRKK